MLHNLIQAIEKKGIAKNALASYLSMSEKSFYNKINGITEFTFNEVKKIKEDFFPEYDLWYLFYEEDEGKNQAKKAG